MDRKNILSEGFFDFLKKIPTGLKGLSSMEKYLYKRDPEFKKAVDTVYNARAEIKRILNKK
jgi:hypothetical protein